MHTFSYTTANVAVVTSSKGAGVPQKLNKQPIHGAPWGNGLLNWGNGLLN